MAEENKPELCSACGSETNNLSFYDETDFNRERWLCVFCEWNPLGSRNGSKTISIEHIDHFTPHEIMVAISQMGNTILSAIREKK